MRTRIRDGSKTFDVINCIFISFICCIMLYPILRVVAISLSEPKYIVAGQVGIIPRGFNILGYKIILSNPELWNAYKNTILYTAVGTFLTLLVTSLTAFPLSINDFMFKKSITIYLAITMFFSGGLIPTYIMIVKMGGLNSFWVMVLPMCLSAYNTFIFRSFFQNIPAEIRESALIDGANDLRILFVIILPLSKALLATFALFSAVSHWNSWFQALIYLQDMKKHPVQMILRRIVVDERTDLIGGGGETEIGDLIATQLLTPRNLQMAAVVVVMLPILCVYPFVQRHFVKGVMIGSIKG